MADQILMSIDFGTEAVQIVKGDPITHCFNCPYTTVEELRDGEVVTAYMYEHTHPMNELEAWWKFGMICTAYAERTGLTNRFIPESRTS
jgi:hypothetical protein